ncbi:MAG: 4-hydroxy-tetrahydrodipicolinate reductase [Saprospiraceae bacterium]|jgi:4-hydroxy-tetrahydrodipicolinate reductase
MKVVIIGYGKMGRTIERVALTKGNEVVGHIDIDTSPAERQALYLEADVGIEFSHPDAAYNNITEAITSGLPVVSGTTGWLDKFESIKELVSETEGAFFYASNYSIGVNIFWSINEQLAKIMNDYPSYDVKMEEVHHIHKKDEPSGTAITTSEGITNNLSRKNSWTLANTPEKDEIAIEARREGEVFGIHAVDYKSPMDTIRIYHEAHTRDGFAQGAVMAAQWLHGKQGIYGMKDMLGMN